MGRERGNDVLDDRGRRDPVLGPGSQASLCRAIQVRSLLTGHCWGSLSMRPYRKCLVIELMKVLGVVKTVVSWIPYAS
jgi:hypothetical protein